MKATYFWMALVLGSAVAAPVMAEKYPAHDFKPSVVYSDKALIEQYGKGASSSSTTTAHDPKYPAATFEPVILQAAPKTAAVEVHTPDPKYPAAYFQPSVIQAAH